MSSPLSSAFDHVHVICTDIAASEKWFVEVMGAELVRYRDVQGASAVDLRLGGVNVFLRGARAGETVGEAGPPRFGNDHFGLRVEDIDATVRELKARGAQFDREPTPGPASLRIAFVRGPDGVRIELLQRS